MCFYLSLSTNPTTTINPIYFVTRCAHAQTKINERMSAIYDRFKAQEDSVEKRVDEEQRIEQETDARRAQEKEMKRVQVRRLLLLYTLERVIRTLDVKC